MKKWTIQVNTGAGFTAYKFRDFDFQLVLNQMGRAHAILAPGTTAPDEGDEIKIIWDLGGASERVWFRGSITTKQKDDFTGLIEVWCFDDSYVLYQSNLGAQADFGFRKFAAQTPYTIIQSAGSPRGLLYNGQGNLIMAYATTAANAITAVSPGNALNFRAQTGKNLLNIGRLCEQATSGGGPTYGLEWFVDRSGADAKQFNLVTRRQRAAIYTAESFQLGQDIHKSPRTTETENTADRVKVVGEGSGATRIESAWVGAGTKELVFSDKNIYDATTAGNLANRIYNALNSGTSPRFEAKTHRHTLTTLVGDDVDIVPKGGGGATTYRCLGISYAFRARTYTLELGRSRRFFSNILRDIERALDGLEITAQLTDTAPVTIQPSGSSTYTTSLAANTALAAGGTLDIDNSTSIPSDWGNADAFLTYAFIEFNTVNATTVAVDAHTHDMQSHTHNGPSHTHTYDKADTPTGGTDAAGGGAVGEPHAHALTYTSTASGASGTGATSGPSNNTTTAASATTTTITRQGPFRVELIFIHGGTPYAISAWLIPELPATSPISLTNAYPFSWQGAGADPQPDTVRLRIVNIGAQSVTVRNTTYATLYKRALHKHNES